MKTINPAREISLRGVWREHVLAAVQWHELRNEGSLTNHELVAVFLDLFTGGALEHELTLNSLIVCHQCPYAREGHEEPACELHLGIVEAFYQGLIGTTHIANRVIQGKE